MLALCLCQGLSSSSVGKSAQADLPASHAAPATNSSSKWGPASDIEQSTVVIVAEARDGAPWLAEAPYKSVILPASPSGNEAVAILQFILDNYDDLPPRMIFVNGASIPEQRKVRVCARACCAVSGGHVRVPAVCDRKSVKP